MSPRGYVASGVPLSRQKYLKNIFKMAAPGFGSLRTDGLKDLAAAGCVATRLWRFRGAADAAELRSNRPQVKYLKNDFKMAAPGFGPLRAIGLKDLAAAGFGSGRRPADVVNTLCGAGRRFAPHCVTGGLPSRRHVEDVPM